MKQEQQQQSPWLRENKEEKNKMYDFTGDGKRFYDVNIFGTLSSENELLECTLLLPENRRAFFVSWIEWTHTRIHDIMENGIYEKRIRWENMRQNWAALDNNNNDEYMHARTHILKQYVIHAMIPSPDWCVCVYFRISPPDDCQINQWENECYCCWSMRRAT